MSGGNDHLRVELQGAVHTTHQSLRLLGYAIAAAGLAWGASIYTGGRATSSLAPLATCFSLAIALGFWAAGRETTNRRSGRVRVDADAISVDDRIVVQRGDVPLRAALEIRSHEHAVLRTKSGDVALLADDAPIAAIVDLLVSTWRARPGFTAYLRSGWGGSWAALYGASFLLLTGLGVLALGLRWAPFAVLLSVCSSFLLSLVMRQAVRRVDVAIGADGLELRPLLGRTTLIPYAELASVTSTSAGLVIGRGRPKDLELDFGAMATSDDDLPARAVTLAALVERARTSCLAAAAARPDAEALLARSGRPVDEWMRAVRTVGERQATFRAAALGAEQLWTIVDDPSQPATVRAAAAVALRESLDDPGRVRLRIAADACMAPKLRVALEAAAADGDDALAEALAELEDVPPRRSG